MTKMLKKIILIICTILICMFIGTISSEAAATIITNKTQLEKIKTLRSKSYR